MFHDLIWTHGKNELECFISYHNDIHKTIIFTSEVSYTSVNFLDTTVKIDTDNTIYTTLHKKPTSTNLYLQYESANHSHYHEKGPYGQFLGIRRICLKIRTSLKMASK